MIKSIPEPTWARLGFSSPPEMKTSGEHVGVVIIDTICPHVTIEHLEERVHYVQVNHEFDISHRTIAYEPSQRDTSKEEHGLKSLLTMAHQPFYNKGQLHIGLCPAATFIVLDHGQFKEGEKERLDKG